MWLKLCGLEDLSEVLKDFRHRCTTMPWTIRLALMVLWGVCWIFYGPYDYGDLRSHPPSPVPSQDFYSSFQESEYLEVFSR